MILPNLQDKIKLVLFDIDETLLIKDKDIIPNSVLPAILQLKQNGIIVGIATGRSMCTFPRKIKQLVEQAKIDLFVTINGQYNCYQDHVITAYPMPIARIEKLVAFFNQQKMDYACVSQHHLCVSAMNNKVCPSLDSLNTDYSQDPDYFKHHEVFQMLAFYPQLQQDFVQNSGILAGLKTVRWHQDSVDLLDENGSKARGIFDVVNHFGLTMENVMAFGDGLNDIEMLSQVGHGVAMGNAHEQVKQIAKYVTKDIDQDGIAYFLKQTGLIE